MGGVFYEAFVVSSFFLNHAITPFFGYTTRAVERRKNSGSCFLILRLKACADEQKIPALISWVGAMTSGNVFSRLLIHSSTYMFSPCLL